MDIPASDAPRLDCAMSAPAWSLVRVVARARAWRHALHCASWGVAAGAMFAGAWLVGVALGLADEARLPVITLLGLGALAGLAGHVQRRTGPLAGAAALDAAYRAPSLFSSLVALCQAQPAHPFLGGIARRADALAENPDPARSAWGRLGAVVPLALVLAMSVLSAAFAMPGSGRRGDRQHLVQIAERLRSTAPASASSSPPGAPWRDFAAFLDELPRRDSPRALSQARGRHAIRQRERNERSELDQTLARWAQLGEPARGLAAAIPTGDRAEVERAAQTLAPDSATRADMATNAAASPALQAVNDALASGDGASLAEAALALATRHHELAPLTEQESVELAWRTLLAELEEISGAPPQARASLPLRTPKPGEIPPSVEAPTSSGGGASSGAADPAFASGSSRPPRSVIVVGRAALSTRGELRPARYDAFLRHFSNAGGSSDD